MELNVGGKDKRESKLKKSERWWISLADAEGKPGLKVSNVNSGSVDSSIPVPMEVSPADVECGEQENGWRSTKRAEESPELSDGEESEEEVAVVEPSAPKEGSDVVICVPVSEGSGERREIEWGKGVGRGKGNVGEDRVRGPQALEIGVLFGGKRERNMPTKGTLTEENVDPIICTLGDAEREKEKVSMKSVSIEYAAQKEVEVKSPVVDILDECPKDAGLIKTNANGANPVEDLEREHLPDISLLDMNA
ncbi:hypothetical protein J437_LFUL005959 [Ladona fulva]|uniref:Uncharacterized protein n=1 Tax=Ladona fulva TaxID=123851 RepID=A0A8K0K0T5_LADFU|nr:hypothetical protein J437_LFUL005959 [Ladona fulva]